MVLNTNLFVLKKILLHLKKNVILYRIVLFFVGPVPICCMREWLVLVHLYDVTSFRKLTFTHELSSFWETTETQLILVYLLYVDL